MTLYRGLRYWKMDDLQGSERVGWNTRFVPYEAIKSTTQRIVFHSEELNDKVYIDRGWYESKAPRCYHSRHHEYFYKVKPEVDPEHVRADTYQRVMFFPVDALAMLGLEWPCSTRDAQKAYRQMSKTIHPDAGGSHEGFIKLRRAYDEVRKVL